MLTALRSKILTLKKHQGFRRYAANTSWMMVEQILRIISGLLVGIWVARYLGPEQFGLFSYVLAFTAIFGGIAKLGLDGILVRELVNQPEMRDVYLGTAFWLKVAGALLVMVLIAVIVPFTTNDAITNLFIFTIAVGLVFQSFEVVEFYFQSLVQAKIATICKIVQLTLSSLIKIYLVLTQAELFWFVLVTTFDAMSLAVSYFIACKIRGNISFFKSFNGQVAKKLLDKSWPLVFSSIFSMLYLRVDQIMIMDVLGEYEVGIYGAAVKLSESFYFIPSVLTVSLFPAILNAKKIDGCLYFNRLRRLYSFLLWLAFFIAFTFTFTADYLVFYLFGSEYYEAADIFKIHVWVGVFVFISAVYGRYLMAEGLVILNMYRVVFGAILNVLLNLYAISNYGGVGAAYSTLISLFFINCVFDVFFKETRHQLNLKLLALITPVFFIVQALRGKVKFVSD